jgi:DNA-binding transcriptional LysR family regulator
MLDVRRLRVLHTVHAHGSITAAAAVLGYSAPAISQQLASLEREVGMRLTERVGRGIALTPAAEILVAHTDALLAQLDAAEADVAALRDHVAGSVRLAAFPSAGATFVPQAWAALAASAPHVDVDLEELEPDESLAAITQGQLDIAVAHEYDVLPRPLGPEFERRELLADPVFLAVPAGWVDRIAGESIGAGGTRGVAGGAEIALEAFAREPFLVARNGTSCAEMTRRACAYAGFVPRVVARANEFPVLLGLVAAGAGVALIPELAAVHVPELVRLVRPARPIVRQIFAVSRRGGDRRPAVRVVLEALTTAARTAAPRAVDTVRS